MINKRTSVPYVLYLAVLPKYRTECIRILANELGEDLKIFTSSAHLDESVRTGVPADLYEPVTILRLLKKRAFIQTGSWRTAISADTTVLDLNPRSITAWLLLLVRFSLKRRTLLWGHIHPQAGPGSRTAALRRTMRRIANGTISYTYKDRAKALNDIPSSQVWVAPNSLYKAEAVKPAASDVEVARSSALYVGRFAPEKKVSLLIEGFARASAENPEMRLILVGGGEDEVRLRELAVRFGVEDRIEFPGWVDDLEDLVPFYQRSFCSASPGFAGLGLTQSLGFGVPMIVADNEPHSPEIELDASGGVDYFKSDSSDDLSKALVRKWEMRNALPDHALSKYTRTRYSAEAMARGLEEALKNQASSMSTKEFSEWT
jgi:glycosyltransferase involved in cell wall biosynthesis